MATSEPNKRGSPDRPAPDDSLWSADPPLSTPRSAAASGSGRPGAAVPAKRSTGLDPAAPAGPKRPAPVETPNWAAPTGSVAGAPPTSAVVDPPEDENSLNILLGLAQNAPAWLISAVVHTSLLIILGLCLVAVKRKTELAPPGINLSEPSADMVLDDAPLADGPVGTQLIEKNDSQIFTPQNLPQVADPFATPFEASEIRLGGIMPATDMQAPTIGLALHGREAGMRGSLLGAYGGTGATESAVGRGLEWLVKQQGPDGLWSLRGTYSNPGQSENPSAATAMALLAFQGAGITPSRGKYAKVVDKAWTAMLKTQQRDGSFGTKFGERQEMYTHAQCTIALCEVLSMSQDSRFYEPAQRAVARCIEAQDKREGGWRYSFPSFESDMSVTGWFVMALKSAQMARLEVPQETFDNVMRYLDAIAMPDGKYPYSAGSFSTPAVTAEAYLCRQLLGWKQNDPRLIDGCKALAANPVKYDPADRDVYYWYYATQACHNMEGQIWDTWNKIMREELPKNQVSSGDEIGSWDPRGDRWGSAAGRLYTTCLSIYMLEVYYRHLPIYSVYKFGKK